MTQIVVPYNLAYSLPQRVPMTLAPTRYSWHAIGGPEAAEIQVGGTDQQLWDLANWLRRPVEVWDTQLARTVWGGYVHEVEIRLGEMTLGVSLDNMANKVAVDYEEASTGGSSRQTTGWTEDTFSSGYYSVKELKESMPEGLSISAEAFRDRLLAAKKYPIQVARFAERSEKSASLHCRGWWDTLAWKHYACAPLAIANADKWYTGQLGLGKSGGANEEHYRCQTFQPPAGFSGKAQAISVAFRRTDASPAGPGAPDDYVWIDLYKNKKGEGGNYTPEATCGAIDSDTISDSRFDWHTHSLDVRVTLTPLQVYSIHCERSVGSGSRDTPPNTHDYKHYLFPVCGNTYANGSFYRGTSALAWYDESTDMLFAVECVVGTTDQISAIISNAGQFLTALIIDASGVDSNPYRAGDRDAKFELENLLSLGTSSSRRLLASVDEQRIASVYEEPAYSFGNALWLRGDGRIYDSKGVYIHPQTCPVGKWVQLQDILPPIESARLAPISPFFIERSEFDVGNQRLIIEPRDLPSPWEIGMGRLR